MVWATILKFALPALVVGWLWKAGALAVLFSVAWSNPIVKIILIGGLALYALKIIRG